LLHTNGFGWAGSLEGGYPIALAGRLVLEPQAQLIYQRVRFNDGNDGDALVSFSDSDALQGRREPGRRSAAARPAQSVPTRPCLRPPPTSTISTATINLPGLGAPASP
jgi:hypothetical protein